MTVSVGPCLLFGSLGRGITGGPCRRIGGADIRGAANLEGRRFDPFDDDVRAILGAIDTTLRGCEYTGYGDLAGCQQEVSTRGAVLWSCLSIMYRVQRVGTWRCWRQG